MKAPLVFIIFLIFLASVCDTISQLCLKSSVNSLNVQVSGVKKIVLFIRKLVVVPRVWLGFVFNTLSLFLWLFVLSKAELNFAFSVDSMHYIMIALASMWFLKEKVSFIRWMGVAAIVAGITLVSFS